MERQCRSEYWHLLSWGGFVQQYIARILRAAPGSVRQTDRVDGVSGLASDSYRYLQGFKPAALSASASEVLLPHPPSPLNGKPVPRGAGFLFWGWRRDYCRRLTQSTSNQRVWTEVLG